MFDSTAPNSGRQDLVGNWLMQKAKRIRNGTPAEAQLLVAAPLSCFVLSFVLFSTLNQPNARPAAEDGQRLGVGGPGVEVVVGPLVHVGIAAERRIVPGPPRCRTRLRRSCTAPSASNAQCAPVRPYGMPTLPGLITSRRSTSRTNGMWVCPQTTVAGARPAPRPSGSSRVSTSTTSSSDRGLPWQNSTSPKPRTRTVTGCGRPPAAPPGPLAAGPPPTARSGPGSRCCRRRPARPVPGRHCREPRSPCRPGTTSRSSTCDRLRPGRHVAGHHDPFGGLHVRLGQHRLQRRQHAVDVGQYRDRGKHGCRF